MRTGKITGYIALITITCLMAGLVCACQSSGEKKSYLIYYSNSEHDDIIHREYKMSEEQTKDRYTKVSELMHQMFEIDLSDENYTSPKPDNVQIVDYIINSEGILSVDFNSEYNNMTNVEAILLRAAFVLTVIQVEGIEGVEFTVEGAPINNSQGDPVGIMTADLFVNIILNEEGMLKKEADVTLLFANSDGSMLIPVISHFEISSNNVSMEEYVLNQLMAGPADGSGVNRTIDPGVELINVVTTDYTCYVNFGPSFLEQEQSVSDEILIYSIVNSLCRLPSVNSVQFLIDGDSTAVLHSLTDLSRPFTINMSLEEH